MPTFVRWWKGQQADALRVTLSTIDDYWRRGDGCSTSGRGLLARAPCYSTANLYYLVVLAVAG